MDNGPLFWLQVLEETNFDIKPFIREDDKIVRRIGLQDNTLYIIPGVCFHSHASSIFLALNSSVFRVPPLLQPSYRLMQNSVRTLTVHGFHTALYDQRRRCREFVITSLIFNDREFLLCMCV
jgi:hypothetical protein